MITEEEYKQWKPLIEEYEEYLFQQGTLEALYCTKCQALEEHDCFCLPYPICCEYCHFEMPDHYVDCIYKQEED